MRNWAFELLNLKLIRFLIVGGAIAALDFATFLLLIQFGVSVAWANTAGMTLGFIIGLWGHHAMTFQISESLQWRMALCYALTFGFNLILASVSLKVLQMAEFPAAGAKFITITLVAATNFLISRYFVFRQS